jgi:hypothetical protein
MSLSGFFEFANESEEDLDFDDSLEEESKSGGSKPPYRRPIVYILLLILLTVGTYFLKPELFAPIKSLVVSPATHTVDESQDSLGAHKIDQDRHQNSHAVSSPQFHEGQLVTVNLSSSAPEGQVMLRMDESGSKPGPTVRSGELLTVLDGVFLDNAWLYQVHTSSGAAGWIPEDQLQSQS